MQAIFRICDNILSMPLERVGFALPPELMAKVRAIALKTRRKIASIVVEALESYVDTYEKENGEIKVDR